MDPDDIYEHSGGGEEEGRLSEEAPKKPRQLPDDLPTSLDDRRPASFEHGVEVYDAWQGQSQFLTNPIPAQPFNLNLSSNDTDYYGGFASHDSHYNEMIAAQAAQRPIDPHGGNIEEILKDDKLSKQEKKEALHRALTMASSNGDVESLKKLVEEPFKSFVDVNIPDEEGTAALIYACCFGHEEVVSILINAGADVNKQDRHQWTSLMWATTNRHRNIMKLLLDSGASPDVKSSSGRTAFDFVEHDSEISEYLHESGYRIGSVGVGDDFYSSGFSQDKFEEEMAENEMKRRMMMESAINLEVDLGNLGLDEQPESPEEFDENQDFVWDKCLNDQMFVFQENELERILDIIITNMTPQRSPSQKPVPANILFLSARYAHYHANPELLEMLLEMAMTKINDVVEKHQWDMTILAFWMSNATLLLHYLKKDKGLMEVTEDFQIQISDLINEIFVLIIRDAERRIDKVLDASMLDHETIPGFEDIHFQNEWNLFRSKNKAKPEEPFEKRFRPPSPKRRAKVSPRNITSLLSSTLFVLDLYDIHSVITIQILAQLYYWLGAELFNRIMSNRKYLARTKAMQVRMNVSMLEDWARNNNRQPEHYENGSTVSSGQSIVDAANHHLAPVIQLLQWLQVFSSLDDNTDSLEGTIKQIPRLSPQQLMHAVRYYRAEVGEKGLPRTAMKHLKNMEKEAASQKAKRKSMKATGSPASPQSKSQQVGTSEGASLQAESSEVAKEEEEWPDHLLLDPALMLPFTLPTPTDMLVSYGAGFGGANRERERKYIPTVPPEFLAKLDINGQNREKMYEGESFDDEGDDA